MARHNRSGKGVDQVGNEYAIDYQPDWLRRVKVTRKLPSGRQSTMHLFRNPSDCREATPGERVRTGLSSDDQAMDFEIVLHDPHGSVRQVTVTIAVPPSEKPGKRTASGRRSRRKARPEEIVFTFEDGLKPPRGSR